MLSLRQRMPHDIRNCYVVRKVRGASNIVGATHGWELTTGIRRSKRTATLSPTVTLSGRPCLAVVGR